MRIFPALLSLMVVVLSGMPAWAEPQGCGALFPKSLHYRGEGMRYWYEKSDGLMQYTKVPYDQLNCKTCHVKSCDSCHLEPREDAMTFSVAKARNMETCLPCHSREKLAMKMDAAAGQPDVHFDAGMGCADCHDGMDVHGDGTAYTSMRQPGAVKASCENCHTEEGTDAPAFDRTTVSHSQHAKDLDCAACHVQSTMACLNCHFGAFLKTGEKKGNFIPAKNWTLLMNYNGKVTSASAMTFVHRDKAPADAPAVPFIAYAPYFTHSVTAAGRMCDDCHGTEAAVRIAAGETVRVNTFANGGLDNIEGVVPVVPDGLTWTFLDKKDGEWVELPVNGPVATQMVGYGTPLTTAQVRKLAKPAVPALHPAH